MIHQHRIRCPVMVTSSDCVCVHVFIGDAAAERKWNSRGTKSG